MLKKTTLQRFDYSEGIVNLRIWPLTTQDFCQIVKNNVLFKRPCFVAVKNEIWGDTFHPPDNGIVAAQFVARKYIAVQGGAEFWDKPQTPNILDKIIDLKMFFAGKNILSGAEIGRLEQLFLLGTEEAYSEAIATFGGSWVYSHDARKVSFCLKKEHANVLLLLSLITGNDLEENLVLPQKQWNRRTGSG